MKCPGQDSQYWKPGAVFDVKCPKCGQAVEFFKDDPTRKCSNCGHRFLNPNLDFGCASYCQYAEQCIGNLPPELLKEKDDLLKDRVAVEMKRYFKQDFRRIGHATRVARYAEQIGREAEANLAIVLCAAYLHDIGLPESERNDPSAAAQYPENEGPPVARQILEKLGAAEGLIEGVCDIIAHHHHPKEGDPVNFKVLYDADLIANLEEAQKSSPKDQSRLTEIISKSFLTESGRKLGETVLMPKV